MLIFCTAGVTTFAFPIRQIVQVSQSGNEIRIERHTGKVLEENSDSIRNMSDIGAEIISYQDEETARQKMRDFYRACRDFSNVFHF